MKGKKIIDRALEVIKLEANSIRGLLKYADKDLQKSIESIADSSGRVVVTGIGKSANIAKKIVSTFNSTGTPALFMHAADAIHGDLGMIQKSDVVMCISRSGNSPEIKVLIPLVRNMGNTIIGMTADKKSFLGKNTDHQIITHVKKEACPNNLAPTTSTTAQLVMGDVLAVCLMEMKGFTTKDFAKNHPGGALGKKIYTKMGDIIAENAPKVLETDPISKVILTISKGRCGATAVVKAGKVMGIITDGDLRRMMESKQKMEEVKAKDIMSARPKTMEANELAVNGFQLMEMNKINQLIVLEEKKYKGMVHIHDLLKEGIY
ncbi:MAG: KpsF/GutQ family sugar-phosphate isomerase [Flavobacteriales bacterium]|nr:KpsF/GutQ family sugar-phosphate isomerase [Flavobacteriales bacterium]